jgi:hypothetical protein
MGLTILKSIGMIRDDGKRRRHRVPRRLPTTSSGHCAELGATHHGRSIAGVRSRRHVRQTARADWLPLLATRSWMCGVLASQNAQWATGYCASEPVELIISSPP